MKNLTPEDSGKYTCYVSNKNGFINATYEVEVYGKSISIYFKAIHWINLFFLDDSEIFEGIDPLNSTVEIGQSTVFTCRVKIDLVKTILVS